MLWNRLKGTHLFAGNIALLTNGSAFPQINGANLKHPIFIDAYDIRDWRAEVYFAFLQHSLFLLVHCELTGSLIQSLLQRLDNFALAHPKTVVEAGSSLSKKWNSISIPDAQLLRCVHKEALVDRSFCLTFSILRFHLPLPPVDKRSLFFTLKFTLHHLFFLNSLS